MAMPRLIAPAKRLLEQGIKFGPFPLQNYQSYEANIDFEIRCVLLSGGPSSTSLLLVRSTAHETSSQHYAVQQEKRSMCWLLVTNLQSTSCAGCTDKP